MSKTQLYQLHIALTKMELMQLISSEPIMIKESVESKIFKSLLNLVVYKIKDNGIGFIMDMIKLVKRQAIQ